MKNIPTIIFWAIVAGIVAVLINTYLNREVVPKSEPIYQAHEPVNQDFCGENGENCKLGKG